MSLQLLRKLGAVALKPQLVDGIWHKAQISAKNVAKLRKESLLATGKWEFEPEPKEEKPRKPNKGHKHDRQRPARMRAIAENLAGMDERIAKYRNDKREIKASLLDRLTMTPKQLRQKAKSDSPDGGAGADGCGGGGGRAGGGPRPRTPKLVPPSPPSGPGTHSELHPLPFRLLPVRATAWRPEDQPPPTLSVALDACIVPSPASSAGARLSASNVLVLDGFAEESLRAELLEALVGRDAAAALAAGALPGPPPELWERRTADSAGAAPTWGLRAEVLDRLALGTLPAMREVGARLAALFPDADVAFLPSEAIQVAGAAPAHDEDESGAKRRRLDLGSVELEEEEEAASCVEGVSPTPPPDCCSLLANAAVAGDQFSWHQDADPTAFPAGSAWDRAYGDYFNGEPGAPLLASLVLYLNPAWRRDWGGETLCLDSDSGAGVAVAPRPGRALLMHQDVVHRLTPPAADAPGPRFSLVWKLALLPRRPRQALDLARAEHWGLPAPFGSAARMDAVKRALARQARRQGLEPTEERPGSGAKP